MITITYCCNVLISYCQFVRLGAGPSKGSARRRRGWQHPPLAFLHGSRVVSSWSTIGGGKRVMLLYDRLRLPLRPHTTATRGRRQLQMWPRVRACMYTDCRAFGRGHRHGGMHRGRTATTAVPDRHVNCNDVLVLGNVVLFGSVASRDKRNIFFFSFVNTRIVSVSLFFQ